MNNRLESSTTLWPPRVAISAPQGHSGKTIVCIGLCAAYKRRGLKVQPFKRGPDYIDPSWLTAASGRSCRNLDAILMTEKTILSSFQHACDGAGLAIIEGAMGFYDSLDSTGRGSDAHISKLLKCPVLLVINASRMTRSIAALVSGYQHFEPETKITGVILNNVSSSRHEQKLVTAIEQYCGIKVVGSIPKEESLKITERHLGLTPYPEIAEYPIVERIAHRIENYLNLDDIMNIARSADAVNSLELPVLENRTKQVKIGVMYDCAFSFYYPENLEALAQNGAELVLIDSIHDLQLPDIDALYIGGGFPELFLAELEANSKLRRSINRAIEDYMPVYAECAGLMYLCQNISWQGKAFEMVGTIPATVELCTKPQGHGYVKVEVTEKNPLFPAGLTFWGHEFHHSRLSISTNPKFAYHILRGQGIDGRADGIIFKNVLASYVHLHALGLSEWANAFCSLALKYKRQNSLSVAKHEVVS